MEIRTLEDIFTDLDNADDTADFASILATAATNACEDDDATQESIDAHTEIYMRMYRERCAEKADQP